MKTPRLESVLFSALLLSMSAPPTSANETPFEEIGKLLAIDGAEIDHFGTSVAISGTTAIIGAPRDDDNGDKSGSAYLFDLSTGKQITKLLPNDGEAGDLFGHSVAIDSGIAVIGAFLGDDRGEDSGSVYVFDVDTGTEIGKLIPSDLAFGDYFGSSVDLSGTTAIIGSSRDADNGQQSGSAYLYDISTGLMLHKLLPDDGSSGSLFGISVAISGTTAIVGASKANQGGAIGVGAVYLFDTTTGEQMAKLSPPGGLDPWESFGASVEICGTTALVTCHAQHSSPLDSPLYWTGSAYLFDTTTGAQIAQLIPNDVEYNESQDIDVTNGLRRFGCSVSLSNTTAYVGACYDNGPDSGSLVGPGSVYLFDAATGEQTGKLLPSDGEQYDLFGCDVATSGTSVLVGARIGGETGSAYLFDTSPQIDLLGTPYCFGDGTDAPCPCGNLGSAGEGCANSSGDGATLSGSGSLSIAADDLVLNATGLPVGPGLYFQGDNKNNLGDGTFFGDGLRCTGGHVVRIELQFSVDGASETTISIANKGGVAAGDTKHYQLWYRDPNNSPCGSSFNLTNGYEVTWIS